MTQMLAAFFSLYLATLLLLAGSGLFNTYMGMRLKAQSVSEHWVGGLIAGYYRGMVFGARIGHKIIIQVGHIKRKSVEYGKKGYRRVGLGGRRLVKQKKN